VASISVILQGARGDPEDDAGAAHHSGGDAVTAGRLRVKPGNMILVHAGAYSMRPPRLNGLVI